MELELTHILLVEDDPADVRLTTEALKDGKVLNQLHVTRDGVEALQFLRREGEFTTAPRPDLIILDLNLPRMNGKEVLAELQGDEQLRSIPVAILTTSSNDQDVLESYGLGANCYLTKPVDLEQFLDVVRTFEDFWLGMVRLPPRTPDSSRNVQ